MKSAILSASLFALCPAVFGPAALAQEDGKFSVGVGVHYSTGTYGAPQSTDILYVPVTAKYKTEAWTFRLTVPYLQITGPANVINGVGITGAAPNASSTRSGLGDVITAVTRNVYNSGASGWMVNVTGKIKFGTASAAQALGTGQNDYAFQGELYKVSGPVTSFGTLGYKVYGSPPGYALNNVFYGSVGGDYRFAPATSGGILVTYAQKVTAFSAAHFEALAFADHKVGQAWKMQGYILKGFTNSVPSLGAGLTLTRLL